MYSPFSVRICLPLRCCVIYFKWDFLQILEINKSILKFYFKFETKPGNFDSKRPKSQVQSSNKFKLKIYELVYK